MTHGLYIHIPFCAQKCPYCGFYSVTDVSGADAYLNALLTEIKSFGGLPFDTIYVGGGTPSLLGAKLTGFLEEALPWIDYRGGEFTVEVNPESVTKELITGLAGLPVSRISMGAQSTDDNVLKLLGRIHSAGQIFTAYNIIRENIACGINLDLIYDIPTVDAKTIRKSALRLIELKPEHISAYSYSPDTGHLTDRASDDPHQTEMIAGLLESADYRQYEVSNFAIPGHESKHNIKYWNMSPYYGAGAGAHSMLVREGIRLRFRHSPDIEKYINNPAGREDSELYGPQTVVLESVVFGLRRIEGIDLLEIEENFGTIPAELRVKIKTLADEGLLKCEGNRVKVSRKGLLLLDSVMSYLW